MASSAPFLPFLRPLGLPRPSTVRFFMRFSTTTQCSAAPSTREDRNLIASRSAPETYPPKSMRSNPRPKVSRASRRTAHPTKQRSYPTRIPSHHQPVQPKLISKPVEPLPAEKCAPHLPYFVSRSANNELPIYTLSKRGGNMKLTKVKKIDGDKFSLRDQLQSYLGVDVTVNAVTGHVIAKGHYKPKIEEFLRKRMF